MPTPTSPSTPTRDHRRNAAAESLGLELLEATLARVRGQHPTCWATGDQALLTAAHSLVQAASPTQGNDRGDLSDRWALACLDYAETLATWADITTWPTVQALSLGAQATLADLLYTPAVASLRARDEYRFVTINDIPAPENPFHCEHWKTFSRDVNQTGLAKVMAHACGWPGRLATIAGRGAGERRIGTLTLDASRNARNTATHEAFVEWLNTSGQPPCSWHKTNVDWVAATALARQCLNDPAVTWSDAGVIAWFNANAPAELTLAGRSLLLDPIIWAGPGWQIGNGQTRYLALVGAGASHALVVG